MPRMTPAERREAIVDAALSIMVRKGMAATTVRDVAHQMGTSSGLVHHYFESMDDLLAAAFDRAAGRDLDATRAAMTQGAGPVERLSIFFATYVRAEQDWAFQLWLDAWAEAARRPAVRETSQRLNVAWQQLLAETIRAGVERGFMLCGDPEAAAWRILSLLDGLALQAVAHRLPLDRRAVITWSVAYAEVELGLPPGSLAGHDPA
ncbi:MAG: TetR/AcrR family transcriptional regulator [Geodermatophilaceae bacterium]